MKKLIHDTMREMNEAISEAQQEDKRHGVFGHWGNTMMYVSAEDDSDDAYEDSKIWLSNRPTKKRIMAMVEWMERVYDWQPFTIVIRYDWYEKIDGEVQPTNLSVHVILYEQAPEPTADPESCPYCGGDGIVSLLAEDSSGREYDIEKECKDCGGYGFV